MCKILLHIYCSYIKGSIRELSSRQLTSRLSSICFSLRHLPEVGKLHQLALRSEDELARHSTLCIVRESPHLIAPAALAMKPNARNGFNVIQAIFSSHIFRDAAPEYFSNRLSSAYPVFQLFTVEGWYEIPASIGENSDSARMSEMSKLYVVVVVLLGGVFGMSLANAIFVDEMTADNNEELELKVDELSVQSQELKELLEKTNL